MKCLIFAASIAVIASLPAHGGTVILSWTTPGDDTTIGTASIYDLRFSTDSSVIVEWDLAVSMIGEPEPDTAGTGQRMRIVSDALVPGMKYFWGIKAADETYFWRNNSDSTINWSAVSNVVGRAALFTEPYPNPLNPAVATMLFSDIPEGTDVVIVDIGGQTVRHFISVSGGHVSWDATNQTAQLVSVGIYVWYIPGTHFQSKIRVIR